MPKHAIRNDLYQSTERGAAVVGGAGRMLRVKSGHARDRELVDYHRRIQLLELQADIFRMVAQGRDRGGVVRRLAVGLRDALGALQCVISPLEPGAAAPAERRTGLVDKNSGLAVERLTDAGGRVVGLAHLAFDAGADVEIEREAVQSVGEILAFVVEHDRQRSAVAEPALSFECLANTVPGVVYQRRVTPDGDIRYTYVSDGAYDLFGVKPQEILSDPEALFDCFSAEYRSTFRESLLKASRDLSLWDVEAEIVSRDGRRKFTHAIARPQKQDDGSVLWNGIILDATRMKQTERELRDANTRFEGLTSTIPGVVYQRRVDVDGSVRYTYISEGARDLFGVAPEEILADPDALFACHGPEYRQTFRERLLQASRELTMWDVEAEIVTRDGKRKYTHAIARPQKQADGSVLWTGVILDATRMKRAKRALRAAKEQAEAASAAKSEFLANMSHELRTPLNAVIGFSETMLGEIFGPLGHERYREYMQDIHLSGAHLLDLVNDILDLSKVAAGEAEVRDDIVDLRELTEICAHLVEERVHKADLTIDIDANIGLKVRADETKLRQILLNLLSNAIKFTSGGGRIELSAARSADGWFELRVVDNGIGIDPERIPEMLQPFQQVESAMSRKNGGTGLGLPLVKALAELHDGRFELRSEPDVGTTAIVTLPADRAVGQRAA